MSPHPFDVAVRGYLQALAQQAATFDDAHVLAALELTAPGHRGTLHWVQDPAVIPVRRWLACRLPMP